MDMKKILQALDGASAKKPAEGSNDMKKFMSIVTEGSNPHKVALPVQMAMQHYQEEEKKPVVAKKPSALLSKYMSEAEEFISEQDDARKEQLKMYAQKIAQRVLENRKNNSDIFEASEVPYYVDLSTGAPMAKTGVRPTAIVPSKLWTSITPEIEAKASAQGFHKVKLSHDGKIFFGLEGGDQKLGSKIIVSPADFSSLQAKQAPIPKF